MNAQLEKERKGFCWSWALKVFCPALLICAGVLITLNQPAYSKSAASRLYEIRARKSTIEARIRKLKKEKGAISQEIEALDRQIESLGAQKIKLENELEDAQKDLDALKERLQEIIEEIEYKKDKIRKRILATYMQGEVTYLNVLFEAENIREFMNHVFYLNLILEGDRRIVQELNEKKAEKERYKLKIEAKIEDIANKRSRVKAKMQEISDAKQSKAQLLNKISRDAELAQKQLEELEEESKRIEAEIRRMQGRYKGPAWRGRFLKPVDGTIRSGFGMRRHPIFHIVKMHTGVDIAAGYGTPIRAGGNGMVIFTGWRGGYGLTVIIDHGERLSTLYAHLSRIAVADGQVVEAGQIIGYVGSTGYSTGPHLHFEVRVNGTPVDPLGRY